MNGKGKRGHWSVREKEVERVGGMRGFVELGGKNKGKVLV